MQIIKWKKQKMKKQIKIIIDTEEDNEQIGKCLRVYFLNSFKNPDKQLISIEVEDLEGVKEGEKK